MSKKIDRVVEITVMCPKCENKISSFKNPKHKNDFKHPGIWAIYLDPEKEALNIVAKCQVCGNVSVSNIHVDDLWRIIYATKDKPRGH